MTKVTVNERSSSQPPPRAPTPPPARRSLLRRLLGWRVISAFSGALVLVAVFHLVVMPRLVRWRVRAALDQAGFPHATFAVGKATPWGSRLEDVTLAGGDHVDRIDIGYTPVDLWHGQVDLLRFTGLRYAIPPVKSEAKATTQKSRSYAAEKEIPIRRIEVVKSKLVLPAATQPIEIPIDANVEKEQMRYRVELSAADAVKINGTIGTTLRDGRMMLTVANASGEMISKSIAAFAPAGGVSVGGSLSGDASGEWKDGSASIRGKLQIMSKTEESAKASKAKLSVTAGVLQGVMRADPTTRPSLELTVAGLDLATSNLSAQDLAGTIKLIDLFPPKSEPMQHLTAKKLTVGGVELTDGEAQLTIDTSGGGIFVGRTRWQWLGGRIAASDVQVSREGPIKMVLHARDVDLHQLLALMAKGKASGTGKITGDIPITIDMTGADVQFGAATLSAAAGGEVQIKDAEAIAPTAEAAAQAAKSPSQSAEIKRNITQALSDFQFEQLSAQLKNEPGGLMADIHMVGHGRGGAKQGLDYNLRVHGVDKALKTYLNIQSAVNMPAETASTRKAEPK